MATITKFEELEMWQEARRFARAIFEVHTNSDSFSKDNKSKEQINRSGGPIMDNIAEGFKRNELIQFLSITKGSVGEIEFQLHRAFDSNYITKELFDLLCFEADESGKRIGGFINYLNKKRF